MSKSFGLAAVLPIQEAQLFTLFDVSTAPQQLSSICLSYFTHWSYFSFYLILTDDFKPASVDTSKMATVDILPNNEVNVTVPHCDSAGAAQTSVFRGPKKPYAKECVLIIDHNTGEITLERLSHNIQLKKTRYYIDH